MKFANAALREEMKDYLKDQRERARHAWGLLTHVADDITAGD